VPHRIALARTGRQPFELAFFVSAMFVGALLVLAPDGRPASVKQSMPELIRCFWEVGLFLTGFLGLLAILLQSQSRSRPGNIIRGLYVEAASMCFGTSALAMYGIALLAVNGWNAAAAAAFVIAFAAGCAGRLAGIVHDLRIPPPGEVTIK
jgi:hypothetical protein